MKPHQHLNSRALMYAECCFETFRCIQGEVFALAQHIDRLKHGLMSFGLDMPAQLFPEAIVQASQTASDCLVRVTVGGAHAPWGLYTPTAHPTEHWIQTLPTPIAKEIHLQQVNWPFPYQQRQAKYTSDYALSLRALNQWQLKDNHQALICDQKYIQTGMTANVLLYQDGRWFTPNAEHMLPGIVRSFLLQQGVLVAKKCPLDMLHNVEAIALSNSGHFITPVHSLNGRILATHGDIFNQLWQPLLSQKGVSKAC